MLIICVEVRENTSEPQHHTHYHTVYIVNTPLGPRIPERIGGDLQQVQLDAFKECEEKEIANIVGFEPSDVVKQGQGGSTVVFFKDFPAKEERRLVPGKQKLIRS